MYRIQSLKIAVVSLLSHMRLIHPLRQQHLVRFLAVRDPRVGQRSEKRRRGEEAEQECVPWQYSSDATVCQKGAREKHQACVPMRCQEHSQVGRKGARAAGGVGEGMGKGSLGSRGCELWQVGAARAASRASHAARRAKSASFCLALPDHFLFQWRVHLSYFCPVRGIERSFRRP